MNLKKSFPLYDRIREIIESAQTGAARSVNTAQVVSNWLIGREIIEAEQKGHARAEYGKQLVEELAERLQKDFGKGYSSLNLWFFRRFYAQYPHLVTLDKPYSPRKESKEHRSLFDRSRLATESALPAILYALRKESWKPGILHPNLSWTHYRMLLKADDQAKRAFYEIEAIKNNWSARELERQMASLLHERLSLSRDKKGLMRLATRMRASTARLTAASRGPTC